MFLRRVFQGVDADKEDVLEDIAANLRNIFATKRGCGYFVRNYGFSDLSQGTTDEALAVLGAEIRENIRLFEPRLEILEIEEDYDDTTQKPTIQVRCRVRGADPELNFTIDPTTRTLAGRGD